MNLVKLTKCKLLGFLGFLLCFFLFKLQHPRKIIVDNEIVALLNLFGFE